MKHIFIITAAIISMSASAHAFTACKNADSSFTISIYETTPVKVLIMDQSVSSAIPLAYDCEKQTLSEAGNILAAYGCVGGGRGDEKKIAVYVNQTQSVANYQDLENEQNDKSNLQCESIK